MDHPFQVGQEVAIVSPYNSLVTFVTKVKAVHKNGNFTLERNPDMRWKPQKWLDMPWRAFKVGQHYRSDHWVRLNDTEFQAEQAELKSRKDLENRANAALNSVVNMRASHLTEWQVEALEYFVKLCKGA